MRRIRKGSGWPFPDERACPSICDGFIALAGIICAVRGDQSDLDVLQNLIQQLGKHRRIADIATGDLDGPNFQRLLVGTDMDLAPQAAFGTTMFARVLLAFALRLDAGR
ncbi:hypothetical protein OCH239_18950 [Roseivivax halodurans JCM 10272]|uniref:Uncharacterized protein n=1 Tax=Roseivivax halodurans JCM 10272 TaxID=1449350 RepID=X7E7Z7_9RHOB|nr:hypothetical protein OCH239_18950 [Roseivivax halodurans JCM 10272]